MGIWSIHSKYLDTKGLVALWREALLAKKVIEGKTKGYKKHPQLNRFKATLNPEVSINYYLESVWKEAERRNYNFDKSKFIVVNDVLKIDVTSGQINFERKHLMHKLKTRDNKKHDEIKGIVNLESHPLFNIIEGEVETWEKV